MKSSDDEMMQLQAGKCCWHCRFYIRPAGNSMTDGPIGNICTVDRERTTYEIRSILNPGDKETWPDDSCNRFEMELPPKTLSDTIGSPVTNRRLVTVASEPGSVTQPGHFPLLSSLLGVPEEQRKDICDNAFQLIEESKLGCLALLKPPASGKTFPEIVAWYCENAGNSEAYDTGFIDNPKNDGAKLGLSPNWIITQSNTVAGEGWSTGFRYYPNIYSAVKCETQQTLFGLCILNKDTQRQDWTPAAELQCRKAHLLLKWIETYDDVTAGCNYAKGIISSFEERNVELFETISDYIQTESFFEQRAHTGTAGAIERPFDNYMTKFDQPIWHFNPNNPDEWAWSLAFLPSSLHGT